MSTAQLKYCPQCQSMNAMSAAVCTYCGRVFKSTAPKPITCAACERILEATDRYCRVCGHPAGDPVSSSVRKAPPPTQYSYGSGPVRERPSPALYQQPVQQQPYQNQQPGIVPGVVQKPPGLHSVGTSILLHFLLTGAGQMVNGQVGKGLLLLLATIVLTISTAGVGGVVMWVVVLIDAAVIAGRLNRGEAVGLWQFF